CVFIFFFFFNDTATTEIYTLSLHDALPIYWAVDAPIELRAMPLPSSWSSIDRKSTRLNSSHVAISYAVFCLKKKNDNDLVRRFPEPGETGAPRSVANEEFFTRLGQALVRLLETLFFFNVAPPPEIYFLPFRDAFPI